MIDHQAKHRALYSESLSGNFLPLSFDFIKSQTCSIIRCILSEITVESFSSDCDSNLIVWDYIPVKFEVKFIRMTKNETTSKNEFIKKADGEELVIKSVNDFMDLRMVDSFHTSI